MIELGIANAWTSEDEFLDLRLRHKTTLCRISLSDNVLETGTWDSAFQRLSAKLLNLRRIRLRGHFASDTSGEEFHFDTPGGQSGKIAPLGDAVENHILGEGEWPDVDTMPWQLGAYPWEDPEYVKPGLSDDDPDPTDPALRYECDDFDSHM